jgi:O-antigen/teichoic acid export membrane protein
MSDEKMLIPSFYTGFLKLFSGLVAVQLLNFSFSLILPRYYSPVDYAFFGVFTAIIFILIEIVTLKLDITIFFQKDDEEALEIVHAIFFICFCFTVIVLALSIYLFLFYDSKYILLSLSLFVYGMVLPLSAWFNRQKDYRRLNTYRIVQALMIPFLSLLFILVFNWHFGLVLGFILGQMAGLLYLLSSFRHFSFSLIRYSLVSKYLREYQHFPKYGVVSSLIGSISRNSIVLFVKYFFGSINAGYYTMSTRILNAPAGMYQSAISQVFLQQASHLENAALKIYIKKIVWFGFSLGIVPVIALLFFGQQIFGWLFGTEWLMAGKMSQYIVLWVFFMALITPVGLLLDIKQKLKFEAGWNSFLLILRMTAIFAGVLLNDLFLMLLILCGVGVSMSLYLLYCVLKLTNDKAD